MDPGTGTILRLTIQADPEKASPIVRSGVLVEYGPITIGGKAYVCPLKSVTIEVFYPGCTVADVEACGAIASARGLPIQESLNDVSFSQYHVFRAEAHLLEGNIAPPTSSTNRASVDADPGQVPNPAVQPTGAQAGEIAPADDR